MLFCSEAKSGDSSYPTLPVSVNKSIHFALTSLSNKMCPLTEFLLADVFFFPPHYFLISVDQHFLKDSNH